MRICRDSSCGRTQFTSGCWSTATRRQAAHSPQGAGFPRSHSTRAAVQAASDKHKVKLSHQEIAATPDVFHRLPARLRDLVAHSMRLQARIIHLDQLLYARTDAQLPAVAPSPVAEQIEKLRMAFAS